ncbi:M42 family peptidase [Pseudoflavonifractor phocaeensis]|uniref:M42 family peptidase n=1 Tax=Pseudoflavonifractor phocaeensis TaxID=1870988 RepID=UPI00195D0C64|nr:M42 family peptidase [Pseudoflavonifractor phocaeensis]MBM6926460.1 M42 family peptidase [Pseudoflavonifractor phocaeensis]
MRQTLEGLCGCTAPSGFESPAAQAARDFLAPFVDETWVDRMGNLLGVRRCGREGAKKVLLDAHLDEIGLMVTGAEEGFLRFRTIGGVDPRMLPGRELTILTEPPMVGIVAAPGPHQADTDKSIPITELVVDAGLTQAQAEELIGTPMVYRGSCFPLGEGQMCGKAMDDRSCFATLLRCMELLKDRALDVDVYVMGSTREEVSGAGATVGTWAVRPDCCVAVDVTHGRTPDGPADKTFVLGGGPAVGVGPNMTRWMTKRLLDKAVERKIPCQQEIMSGHTGTNGWEMQISREGVATAVLSVPLKYMHSPIETLSLDDLEHTAALLAAFVTDLGKEGPL